MTHNQEDEISLIDVLSFIKGGWKPIAISGIAGIALSIAYLTVTPPQFQASAQIALAQIEGSNGAIFQGVNIEEPALLIARLSSPGSFPSELMVHCGLEGQENAGLSLRNAINLTALKGVSHVVELKTFGQTPQIAQECAVAVFEFIKMSQSKIAAPYVEEAKVKIADQEERLQRVKDLATKVDKSGHAMNVSSQVSHDEIRHLLNEIAELKRIVSSIQSRGTHLISPVYAAGVPIAPIKRTVLAIGLFAGICLGLLIALARQAALKLKTKVVRDSSVKSYADNDL